MATPEAHDERTLIEAAQKDPARFLEIYDLYFPRVWAFAIRRAKNAPKPKIL